MYLDNQEAQTPRRKFWNEAEIEGYRIRPLILFYLTEQLSQQSSYLS